jgi:hypothetical protein
MNLVYSVLRNSKGNRTGLEDIVTNIIKVERNDTVTILYLENDDTLTFFMDDTTYKLFEGLIHAKCLYIDGYCLRNVEVTPEIIDELVKTLAGLGHTLYMDYENERNSTVEYEDYVREYKEISERFKKDKVLDYKFKFSMEDNERWRKFL